MRRSRRGTPSNSGSSARKGSQGAGIYFDAEASAKDVGLPIYPGARPHRDKDENQSSGKFGLWGNSFAFKLAVEQLGIRHRYIKPRRPQQNGKVERSHRIDDEEFWSRHDFEVQAEAEGPLADWEQRYNHDRFSLALHGRTPAEKLQAVLATGVITTHIQENVQ